MGFLEVSSSWVHTYGGGHRGWSGGRSRRLNTAAAIEAEQVPHGPAQKRPGTIDEAEDVHACVLKKASGSRR